MVKRKVRKKRKSAKQKVSKSLAVNRKAHWDAYKDLESRANKAWAKLRTDIKRKASPQVLLRDQNDLLLLLGECNYMTRECLRCSHGSR